MWYRVEVGSVQLYLHIVGDILTDESASQPHLTTRNTSHLSD